VFSYGEAAFDLLSRMLELNPEERITASEAVHHEFFKISPRPWKAME
jgi:serine/threonine protein kinase